MSIVIYLPKRRKVSEILGDGTDFSVPLVSLMLKEKDVPHNSNISDDDFVDIPSSQATQNLSADKDG